MADIWNLLQRRLRSQPSAPLVTWVAGAARVELSAATLANSATKIANGLRGDLELEPGARVVLDLGQHWQRSAWCAGVWVAGCVLDTAAEAPDLRVIGAGSQGAAGGQSGAVGVVSLHPLGLPDRSPLLTGALDLARLIPAQSDQLLLAPAPGSTACYRSGRWAATQEELLLAASELAAEWGLQAGGRLLAPAGIDADRLWLACLAVPLVCGAAVVLAPGGAEQDPGVARREGITAVAR